MTSLTPSQKLDYLIPSSLQGNKTKQEIINEMYKNNLGNKLLNFIYELKNNIARKNRVGMMCVPKITWTPSTSVTLTCVDNIFLFGALNKSRFLRLVNIYAGNVQTHRNYLYMRSQGKFARPPLTPQN